VPSGAPAIGNGVVPASPVSAAMAPFRTKGKPFSTRCGFRRATRSLPCGTAWATCGPCTSRGSRRRPGAGSVRSPRSRPRRKGARRRTGGGVRVHRQGAAPGSLFRCAAGVSTGRGPLTQARLTASAAGTSPSQLGQASGAASGRHHRAADRAVGRLLRVAGRRTEAARNDGRDPSITREAPATPVNGADNGLRTPRTGHRRRVAHFPEAIEHLSTHDVGTNPSVVAPIATPSAAPETRVTSATATATGPRRHGEANR
jgi:hypothetical protein